MGPNGCIPNDLDATVEWLRHLEITERLARPRRVLLDVSYIGSKGPPAATETPLITAAEAAPAEAAGEEMFDLNKPPAPDKPYVHQEYPFLLYCHATGTTCAAKDAEERRKLLVEGWSEDPYPAPVSTSNQAQAQPSGSLQDDAGEALSQNELPAGDPDVKAENSPSAAEASVPMPRKSVLAEWMQRLIDDLNLDSPYQEFRREVGLRKNSVDRVLNDRRHQEKSTRSLFKAVLMLRTEKGLPALSANDIPDMPEKAALLRILRLHS